VWIDADEAMDGPEMVFEGRPVIGLALACFVVADLPLSAVGDTLTAPLVLYLRAHGRSDDSDDAWQRIWLRDHPDHLTLERGDNKDAAPLGAERAPPH
jgi:hypothetical protein